MSLDSSNPTPRRGRSRQDLWPKWMWIAVPVLVVVVVAGLWWAIFSEPKDASIAPTPSPTVMIIRTQPTQAPTAPGTLPPQEPTATRPILPLPSFTPTAGSVMTPPADATIEVAGLKIGAKPKVVGTGGLGLNMRSDAGTGHARVKTLREGSVVEVIAGPKDADGFTWWQVRDQTGVAGWVAAKFLSE